MRDLREVILAFFFASIGHFDFLVARQRHQGVFCECEMFGLKVVQTPFTKATNKSGLQDSLSFAERLIKPAKILRNPVFMNGHLPSLSDVADFKSETSSWFS